MTLQPGVDGEKDVTGHPWDVRLAAFRDMIIYYRNNPAIIIWEGGNQSVSKEHVEALTAMVKKYDPYGGRAYAHRRCNTIVAPYCDITISTEGSGYQKSLPTVEGEYNREESPRRIWDDFSPPTFGYTNAVGRYKLNSEQYAVNQVFQFDKIAPRHHCGGANWIFSDSTSGGRVQSEVARASGEVDGVRLPKEAYWVCKVLFTPKPDLHIIGHWTYPKGTVKNIYVAADCSEVELFLNGKSLGRKKAYKATPQQKKELHKNLFVFPNVTFQPGTLEAVGYVDGKEVDRQKLETAGPAVALKITPITGPKGFLASGSDVALFDVEAVDAQGRRCPTFQQRCDFECTGPAIWRGGYNSGKTNSINKTFVDLECGINRVSIRSTLAQGKIRLVAKSKGLKNGVVELVSKPVKIEGGIQTTNPTLFPVPVFAPAHPPTKAEQAKVAERPVDPSVNKSKIFTDISYSGPSGPVQVDTVAPGVLLFTDSDLVFKAIPKILQGSEMVRFPDADWNYSAVDLIQFECKQNATIYVALDSRITPMDWMAKYKKCKPVLTVGKNTWTIYKTRAKVGEAILMGSNTEITKPQCHMMILFAQPKK
jgi:beta-galactosidase